MAKAEARIVVDPAKLSDVRRLVRDLEARLHASQFVCAERERELLELKGPCSVDTCRLHYAHAGPCDLRPAPPAAKPAWMTACPRCGGPVDQEPIDVRTSWDPDAPPEPGRWQCRDRACNEAMAAEARAARAD